MSQAIGVAANETAGMLEARLRVVERIRRVEHLLAREEQARIAAALMKGFSHELGNQVQIVKLSAHELARRLSSSAQHAPFSAAYDGALARGVASAGLAAMNAWSSVAGSGASSHGTSASHSGYSQAAKSVTMAPRLEVDDLLTDMSAAADAVSRVLAQMFAAARPGDREALGPAFATAVRAAVELVQPAVVPPIELRVELPETVRTYATADEIEAMVLAAVLDAAPAERLTLLLRERKIRNRRWVELLRFDDRHHMADGELAHMFEPHSLLHVVAGVAKAAGGDASLSPGREGLELAVELPVGAA